jgi:tripartite-type tricarboxylate transporter receptor subunit TctC
MDRTTGVACLLAFAAACGATSVSAQAWPAKPIRLVLGYTVGGAAEGTARALQPRLEQLLGQPLVMEYKPGARRLHAASCRFGSPHDRAPRAEGGL